MYVYVNEDSAALISLLIDSNDEIKAMSSGYILIEPNSYFIYKDNKLKRNPVAKLFSIEKHSPKAYFIEETNYKSLLNKAETSIFVFRNANFEYAGAITQKNITELHKIYSGMLPSVCFSEMLRYIVTVTH